MTDRVIIWQGSIPQDTDLLVSQRNTMVALGSLIGATIGSTALDGFAPTPTAPATLTVNFGAGTIFSQQPLDATSYGSLAADTSAIWKSGINIGATAFAFTAPGSAGQSINYLVECSFVESDANPVVLGYYNAANPTQPLNGPGGLGTTNNTARNQRATLAVKAGTAATTGSQATPTADGGYVGMFVITVAFGQTQITSGNLLNAQLASAPFIRYKLGNLAQFLQNGTLNYCVDVGSANAYVASVSPAPAALVAGLYCNVRITNPNTLASTFNLNGLGVKAITQYNGSPIVAGTLVAGGIASLTYDGNSWQMASANGRVKLSANLNLYVATTGSDTLNTGLSVGSPFASIQQAISTIYRNYDFNGFLSQVNVANGTYTGAVSVYGKPVGHEAAIFLQGNTASPSSCLISVTNNNAIVCALGGFITIQGFQIAASGSSSAYIGLGYGMISNNAWVNIQNCIFGPCANCGLTAINGGVITANALPISFTGANAYAIASNNGGLTWLSYSTVTLLSSPSYSGSWATASQNSSLQLTGTTFVGTATGVRYTLSLNSCIVTSGQTLPGNAVGQVANGGQYV